MTCPHYRNSAFYRPEVCPECTHLEVAKKREEIKMLERDIIYMLQMIGEAPVE